MSDCAVGVRSSWTHVIRVYSHCVADIGDSRRHVARFSDLTVHTVKCGIDVADTRNVNKHVCSIEIMALLFRCFFKHVLNIQLQDDFMCFVSEGNKCNEVIFHAYYRKYAENKQE